MQTRVFAEAEVKIFRENEDGEIIDIGLDNEPVPALNYCYAEGIRISATHAVQRRAVTGRGKRKIISRSGKFDDVQVNIQSLFTHIDEEYKRIEIFKPHQRLQVWLDFNDVTLSDEEMQIIKITGIQAVSVEFNGQGDSSIEHSAVFEGEEIIEEESEL